MVGALSPGSVVFVIAIRCTAEELWISGATGGVGFGVGAVNSSGVVPGVSVAWVARGAAPLFGARPASGRIRWCELLGSLARCSTGVGSGCCGGAGLSLPSAGVGTTSCWLGLFPAVGTRFTASGRTSRCTTSPGGEVGLTV